MRKKQPTITGFENGGGSHEPGSADRWPLETGNFHQLTPSRKRGIGLTTTKSAFERDCTQFLEKNQAEHLTVKGIQKEMQVPQKVLLFPKDRILQ